MPSLAPLLPACGIPSLTALPESLSMFHGLPLDFVWLPLHAPPNLFWMLAQRGHWYRVAGCPALLHLCPSPESCYCKLCHVCWPSGSRLRALLPSTTQLKASASVHSECVLWWLWPAPSSHHCSRGNGVGCAHTPQFHNHPRYTGVLTFSTQLQPHTSKDKNLFHFSPGMV